MATIQKRGDSYKITVSCGYQPDGTQVRRTTTWTPQPAMTPRQIEKELQRQAVLFEEQCKAGTVADSNIKFQAFAEQWFREYAEVRLKKRTIDLYHQFEARTYKALGHLAHGSDHDKEGTALYTQPSRGWNK